MKLFSFLILTCSQLSFAWEHSFKTDFTRNTTDNVNSTSTSLVKDTYSNLAGTLQTKNEVHKFKLKMRIEKYQVTNSNDNYNLNLSYNFKETKTHDYTFEVFTTKYTNVPASSIDSSSDNIGAKITTSFTKNFTNEKNAYVSFAGSLKNYTYLEGRRDTIFDANLGYENYFTQSFSMTPEFSLQYNKSSSSYYSNLNLGPAIYLNFNSSEDLEFFVNAYLIYTKYSGREYSKTVNSRTTKVPEHQSLFISEIGMIYTLFDKIPLQVKYSTTKNSSNNPSSAYKSNLFTFNVGIKI